jgi:sugar phosphate isomerase/epimerase
VLSRRRFWQSALALPVAVRALKASNPVLQFPFPVEPRQRLAVTSYPFREFIVSPTNSAYRNSPSSMDLCQFPSYVAHTFGVLHINPLGDHLSSTEAGYLDRFRRAVETAGSQLVDLGLSGREFASPVPADRDEAVAYGRHWIDIAARIGSPSVRQHLKATPGVAPSVEFAAESLGHLAEYGAKKKIVVNLENDSPGAEDPFFLAAVLEKVNHPYLRALPDFGNSLRGHDAAYNRQALEHLFPYACNLCHVKDILRTKEGLVYRPDLPTLFAMARAHSYHGYFSMEFDTAAGDPVEGTKHLIQQTLQYMG